MEHIMKKIIKNYIVYLFLALAPLTANAYTLAPGVNGTLIDVVKGKIICMGLINRNIIRTSGHIGFDNHMGVIANIDKFRVLSIHLKTHIMSAPAYASLQSDRVDTMYEGNCRIDINLDILSNAVEIESI